MKRDTNIGKIIKVEDEHVTREEGRIEHISAQSLIHHERYEMAFRIKTEISTVQEEIISENSHEVFKKDEEQEGLSCIKYQEKINK